jgi:hypothetical protein
MQKWEYITISFSAEDGRVDEVNTKPIRKKAEDEEGNLSLNEKYRLHEYLAILGKDGWEVVTTIGRILIAKRPFN